MNSNCKNSNCKKAIKAFILFSTYFALANNIGFTQSLIIRGTILCKPKGHTVYERPVNKECIIVFPNIARDSATISSDDGVFDITLPFTNALINRNIIIKCYNQSHLVGHSKIFLSSEALRNEEQNKVFKIRQPITLNKECDSLNSDINSCQTELNKIKSGLIDTTKVSWYYKTSPILGGATVFALAALAGRAALADLAPPDTTVTTVTDTLLINSIRFPKVDLVDFYLSLLNTNSSFRGMNYASTLDFETSSFLNPSSIVFSNFRNFFINSDFTKYIQISGTPIIFDKFALGTGLLFLSQNEDIIATLKDDVVHKENRLSNILMALVSVAYKMNEHLSFGLSTKFVQQKIEQPRYVLRANMFRKGELISTSKTFKTNKSRFSHFDIDVSLTFTALCT